MTLSLHSQNWKQFQTQTCFLALINLFMDSWISCVSNIEYKINEISLIHDSSAYV